MLLRIERFAGGYGWLSNGYKSPITYGPYTYPTVWHAFYAQRALNKPDHDHIASQRNWRNAKAKSAGVIQQPGWVETRSLVMLKLLRLKFDHKTLAEKLLATGDAVLYNTSTEAWNYPGTEGRILMEVRDELRQTPYRKLGIHSTVTVAHMPKLTLSL